MSEFPNPAAAAAGQVLVLTQALGTGVVAGLDEPPPAVAAAAGGLDGGQAEVAEAAAALGVTAGASVARTSLLEAAVELADASSVGIALRVDRVPVIDGVLAVADIAAEAPAGVLDRIGEAVEFHPQIVEAARAVMATPETTGGALVAVDRDELMPLMEKLGAGGQRGMAVGKLIPEPVGRVGVVTPVNTLGVTGGGSRTAARTPEEGEEIPPPPPPGMTPPGGMPGPGMPPGGGPPGASPPGV